MSAVEYKNPVGKSLWQPALEDGQRLWIETAAGIGEVFVQNRWKASINDDPWHRYRAFLCGRRRALRIAAREQRRIDKARLAVFHEVVSEQ